MKSRLMYLIMTAGGVIGMVAAFLQTLENLVLLQNSGADLACNFNSVFNCSAVLTAWQSSLFGFPNSIMCLVLFTIFTTVGFVGIFAQNLPRTVRLSIQGLNLFTLAFALWFLYQSTYVIGALCIFCIVCFAGLLMTNWAWLRLNVADLPVSKDLRATLQRMIKNGTDTFIWAVLAAVVVGAMLIQFYV